MYFVQKFPHLVWLEERKEMHVTFVQSFNYYMPKSKRKEEKSRTNFPFPPFQPNMPLVSEPFKSIYIKKNIILIRIIFPLCGNDSSALSWRLKFYPRKLQTFFNQFNASV